MKVGAIICSAIAIIWVMLAVFQLWFSIMSLEIFIKLSITLGLLFIIVLLLALVIREYLSDKQLKKDGYIDE